MILPILTFSHKIHSSLSQPIIFHSSLSHTHTMVGFTIRIKKKQDVEEEEWLQKLLQCNFFLSCNEHEQLKKSFKNKFCIDCRRRLCPHCVSSSFHSLHRLLQIRKYVYEYVVNIQDMQKYFNCAKIQTYKTNNSKVVHLNVRKKSKHLKFNNGVPCEICRRSIQPPNRFCSVACKFSESRTEARREGTIDPLFAFRSEEEPAVSSEDDEAQESEDESIQSDDTDMELSDGNGYNDPRHHNSFRPKHRLFKRKGVALRSPYF